MRDQVTTVSYELTADPLKVTKITDPFGRFATFTYNAAGQLASITDVIGLTSAFGYGPNDFVNRLTTPYGTTTFRHESDSSNDLNLRYIEATDPWEAPSTSSSSTRRRRWPPPSPRQEHAHLDAKARESHLQMKLAQRLQ